MATIRVRLPNVAVIVMGKTAPASTKTKMSRRLSIRQSNLAQRSNIQATNGPRVLPMEIPKDACHEAPVAILTRNAPTQMPGTIRCPQSSKAARAMPVGGHISVIWLPTYGISKPR